MKLRKNSSVKYFPHGGVHSASTSKATMDPKMIQRLMDAQEAIDLREKERQLIKESPLGMYEEDPAGLEMQNPVFDILGFAGPKVVAAFGKRALGEISEAAAKKAADSGRSIGAVLKRNARRDDIESALMDYPDIVGEVISANRRLQGFIGAGDDAMIQSTKKELDRLASVKKELESFFEKEGIPPSTYLNRRDFASKYLVGGPTLY